MAIFLYPILNLVIFVHFVCEEVSGVEYLRSDYSVRCKTQDWWQYGAYCFCWVAVYTIGFPVGLVLFMKRNERKIRDNYDDLLHPLNKELGFLWNDYRQEYYWWEVVELIRKLVLSSCLMVMEKGDPWQVAVAALFSMLSHLAYTHCRPMRDPDAHKLQHLSLFFTTLNYFIGLLLKVEAIQGTAIAGYLMVALNLVILLAVCAAMLLGGKKMERSVQRHDDEKDQIRLSALTRSMKLSEELAGGAESRSGGTNCNAWRSIIGKTPAAQPVNGRKKDAASVEHAQEDDVKTRTTRGWSTFANSLQGGPSSGVSEPPEITNPMLKATMKPKHQRNDKAMATAAGAEEPTQVL